MRILKNCMPDDNYIALCIDSCLSKFHGNLVITNHLKNKFRDQLISFWIEFRNQNTISNNQLTYQQYIEPTCLGNHRENIKKQEKYLFPKSKRMNDIVILFFVIYTSNIKLRSSITDTCFSIVIVSMVPLSITYF